MRTSGRAGGRLPILTAVFVSGAALLSVELAASRVLAPYFGNSLFVWGALIGVVLAGLSVGYAVGGFLVDRHPSVRLLEGAIALGGVAVLAVPVLDERVLELVVDLDPGPRLDPLLASVLLFGPASVVLASVTPIAVRLRARSAESFGGTTGNLFAVSTLGSITGTFATAFFLVPEFGTDEVLGLAAASLFVAVAILGVFDRAILVAGAALAAAALAAVVVFAAAPQAGETLSDLEAANWSPLYRSRGYGYFDTRDPSATIDPPNLRRVFAEDTRYHRLSVVEDGTTRYLRFDNSLQSAMYIREPFRTRFRYTDLFHLGIAYAPRARRVLYVGLGAGSSPKQLWRAFPDVTIDVVELDPRVVDVGYRFFHVPRDERLRIHVGDGRRYLAERSARYDVIVIDAFFADAIPFHLVTTQFLALVRARLTQGGVVVTNVIGALEGSGSRLFRSVYRTYKTAFPSVRVHPAILAGDRGDASYRNLIVVAGESAAPQPTLLASRWETLRADHPLAPDLRKPIL
ncbi:MAG TPA: fused MFS/spermidine synthase, partial [Gaiellaceae bacterium]|nr:fused MFS/spermidine synthase [Gaiellaceae bacterium]